MFMPDVNILVYAHREDSPFHAQALSWLEDAANARTPFSLAEPVLSGFVRVVTHPRVFTRPSTLDEALEFAQCLAERRNVFRSRPGLHHWTIFVRLCQAAGVRGSLVADAYLAALAIEQGAEWVTTDRDFARFPGLRWRHLLDL